MAYEYKLERRVEFADTDMAGIVHFSNYFRYMEAAEHAFFRSLGFTLHDHAGGVLRGFARVGAECRYARPLRYPELFEVHLVVRAVKRSSLSYAFVFRAGAAGAEGEVARGALDVVSVTRGPAGEPLRATAVPDALACAIEVAPEDLLEATSP